MAGGFAVEPYEFIDLFEQFGGVIESPHPEVMERSVAVSQIETRNPHFHDNKGDQHVIQMRKQALGVLYHSPVCLESVRTDILEFLVSQGELAPGEEPPKERIYPPVGSLALDRFHDVLTAEAHSLRVYPEGAEWTGGFRGRPSELTHDQRGW
jgi:mannosyl-3-phosphoglycerate synthase